MFRKSTVALALFALVASFLLLYEGVLRKLLHDWLNDDNYSHGLLIVPLALWFAWERRDRLKRLPMNGSWFGLLVAAGAVALLVAGTLGAELFLTRISIVFLTAGTILFLFGWAHLRVLAFPVAFLLLMIPLPAIIFNQIAFPLQLVASRFGETTLMAAGIPVLREGNVITLAHTSLEVAEACSGIRSLISLLTLGIVYGYFAHQSVAARIALALATIPIAIVANGLRVAGTGIAAHYYGVEAAEGFFHTFSGWLVFAFSFLMLFALDRAIGSITRGRPRSPRAPVVERPTVPEQTA